MPHREPGKLVAVCPKLLARFGGGLAFHGPRWGEVGKGATGLDGQESFALYEVRRYLMRCHGKMCLSHVLLR